MRKMTQREFNTEQVLRLADMKKGQGGWICRLEGPDGAVRRMLEMGLIEEAYVEVVHEAPFGRDPIAVRVRGALLAVRRQEAQYVSIRKVQVK
jgi:ferrous iron transport protein A